MTKWNEEKIHTIALKYKTRNEFKNNDYLAYTAARKRRILDKVCSHMSSPIIQWTKEAIHKKALKYERIVDFMKNDNPAYQAARRADIMDEVCSHMIAQKESWDKDKIHKIALKYSKRVDFMTGDEKAYNAARRLKLLDEVCSHMEYVQEQWTYEKLRKIAKKYSIKNEFKRNNNPAYQAALRMGIIDDICSHMKRGATGFNVDKPGITYYLRIEKEGTIVYKIGITNLSVKERFGEEMKYIKVLQIWEFDDGQKAFDLEQKILKEYSFAKYNGSNILKSGNTEMFTHDVLLLDKQVA